MKIIHNSEVMTLAIISSQMKEKVTSSWVVRMSLPGFTPTMSRPPNTNANVDDPGIPNAGGYQ